jgi:hypothetical protein
MDPLTEAYESAAQELKRRILALIPANPQILTMESPFALFKVPGFVCDDLNPSLAQAAAALAAARQEHRAKTTAAP